MDNLDLKQKRKVCAEDFYNIKIAEEPALSPDGLKCAYVLKEVDRVNNAYKHSIWITSTIQGPGKKFTMGGKIGDRQPQWSPDGKKLAFVSNRGGKDQIWVIEADGGEAYPVTEMQNGASNPKWSPCAKWIAFISRVNEDERCKEEKGENKDEQAFLNRDQLKLIEEQNKLKEQKKIDPRVLTRLLFRTENYFRDDRRSHIYITDAKQGSKPRRLTKNDYDFAPPVWSIDGKTIFTAANREEVEDDTTRIDILSIPFEGGELTALSDTDDGNANPRISPDGKWLAYISFSAQRLFEQRLYLHLYSFQGGKRRNLTRMLDMDVLDYQFSNDSNFIYFLANKHGNVHIFRIPLRGNIKKAEQITQGRRQIESFDMAPGAKRILYKVNDITTPGDIFSCGLEGEDEIRLTDVNMEFFEGVALSEHREFWFTSNDGMKIQGWMIRPPDAKENDVTPMVLEIHGGPHIMWGNSFWLEFQILAARGFTVFYCNPRGSEGYGWKFKGLIYKKWGHDDFKDLMCGVDYMISKGNIDPGNLSVVGGSFGGFMTVWIIGHDKRFRAAVAQRGVYNLVSFYGCSDGMQLLDWDFGTVPWEDTWRLWKNSPIAYVKNIETPLLLIHSEADYRAGICTADELFVAMKKLRKEVVFIRYPREGHELSRSGEPDHRVDRLNRIVDWCDKFRTHGSKKTDVRESGENEAQR